jgi:hypothetical protein
VTDDLNIGDTVDVTGPFFETWRAEVIDVITENGRPEARLLCIRPPVDTGVTGIHAGQAVVLSVDLLTVAGDPEGMRSSDGCDDEDTTGRVRPYHRHAVTGKAHAHPGGQLAHTHQTADDAAAMGVAAGVAWIMSGDPAGTDSASAHVFAVLRDVADAEPLAQVYGTGDTLGAVLGRLCTMCGANAADTAAGPEPVDHLLSCPWVRVTHLVGVKADG